MDINNNKPKLSKSKQFIIDEYESEGWQIIYGNNAYLPRAKKWKDFNVSLLVRTNSNSNGRIIWAVKPK